MAAIKKIEYWTDIIRKTPSAYEGKFVIHNETDIFFVSEDMIEAQSFLKKNNAIYSNDLHMFLVPHQFGLVRLGAAFLKFPNLLVNGEKNNFAQ